MILSSFSFLYDGITRFRNECFDRGFCQSVALSVPVVSVGNLTMGGTGKTPIVMDLIDWSIRQGISVGVISRGYKGDFSGAQRVSSDLQASPVWGDEPTMMARKFPQVPVFVHPQRVLAGQALLAQSNGKVKWLIADDAFQHRRLHRQLDIVVLDVSSPLWHKHCLPRGRAREGIRSLKRADFLILTKINLALQQRKEEWRREIENWVDKDKIVEVSYSLAEDLRHLNDLSLVKKEEPIWLVSGVGNPSSFFSLVKQAEYNIQGHTVFADHHPYSLEDVEKLKKKIDRSGIKTIVTTSKDLIKLKSYETIQPFICEAKLKIMWGPNREKLDQTILHMVS